jgi:hypothetical protein
MAVLLRNHRPLYFFSLIALLLLGADVAYALAWGAGLAAGRTPLFHAVLLAGALALAAALVVFGVILNALNAGCRELIALSRRPR